MWWTITGNFGNILPIDWSKTYTRPLHTRNCIFVLFVFRMWWTITGNFGNILPIDWSKTYTRQLHTRNCIFVLFVFRMWWTITGNFGNILPIDWSKTYTRQLHTRVLNLEEERVIMFVSCDAVCDAIYGIHCGYVENSTPATSYLNNFST